MKEHAQSRRLTALKNRKIGIFLGLDVLVSKGAILLRKIINWFRHTISNRAPKVIYLENPVLVAELAEQRGHRLRNASEYFSLRNPNTEFSNIIIRDLARLAGTTLSEAGSIFDGLEAVKDKVGEVCEFGVAHGRTSTLMANLMNERKIIGNLHLFDSFEGLPKPGEKDILLDDIFNLGNIEKYQGQISFREEILKSQLKDYSLLEDSRVFIHKGWINSAQLKQLDLNIKFAYLDMDFYESTYDVLEYLVKALIPGGSCVVDDYGSFSSGPETAVTEILGKYPNSFSLLVPEKSKFAVLTKKSENK